MPKQISKEHHERPCESLYTPRDAHSGDEQTYIPVLEQHGFSHLLREPWWYGHRLLQHPDPRANVHVWSPECPEAARHLIFRDWLSAHPDEQQRYVSAKRAAAEHIRSTGGDTNDYNFHKQAAIREIYGRAFAALGLPQSGRLDLDPGGGSQHAG
jgi:GrpB-like predicted nucleotidyltransferase (UPF0157 family)